ncbi:MAG: hypothetical protein WD844_16240 [Thermoleophilaceae bacterium]
MTDRDREAFEMVLGAVEQAAVVIEDDIWQPALAKIASAMRAALPDAEPPDPESAVALASIPVLRDPMDVRPDGPVSDALAIRKVVPVTAIGRTERAGLLTLLDAAARTRREAAAVPGIGAKSIAAIEAALAARGLHFNHNRQEA